MPSRRAPPVTIGALHDAYRARHLAAVGSRRALARAAARRRAGARCGSRPSPRGALRERARALDASWRPIRDAALALPLFGALFAVKDNIDVAGLPTTAACPAFAYAPAQPRRVGRRARGRRRDRRRQDQPRPVRDRAGRHALAVRRRAQRVRSALHLRRLELGLGGRRGARASCTSRSAPTPRAPAACRPAFNNIVGLQADARPPVARAAWCPRAARSTACRSSR